MRTKKLKTKIRETIKKLEIYLDEANNDIEEKGDTEYDTEELEKDKIFYEEMLNEIELYEAQK